MVSPFYTTGKWAKDAASKNPINDKVTIKIKERIFEQRMDYDSI
jgi:hypothetical protein